MPQADVHERSAKTEVVAHLRDDVRRRVARQANLCKLGRVEGVLGREDGGLVVRGACRVEERRGHELEVARAERVLVVREREHEVADRHAEVRVDLRLQWPHERVALGDERPGCAEREQADALVTRSCTEQVAHKGRATVVDQADDRDGGQERERVLGNPLPAEDGGELVQRT